MMWLPYSGISQPSPFMRERKFKTSINCFTSTLNIIPTASQPSVNNLFHYYMTTMNPNVKYILKDKSIHTLDAAKASALEIERNMEESGMIPSPVVQPHFNGRPRNEVPQTRVLDMNPHLPKLQGWKKGKVLKLEIINEHEQSNPFPKSKK
jgi:hypothetical protein